MSHNFENEKQVEVAVRELIKTQITGQNADVYALENKKVVDIVICRDGANPKVFFLETKLIRTNPSTRNGIGGSKGTGFQPELLDRQPCYFEQHLRWALAREANSGNELALVESSYVRNFLAAGALGAKHNNIQRRILDEPIWVNADKFVEQMIHWLVK
jgi:hypothetical protein